MSQFNRRDVFVAPDDTFHSACANEDGLTLDGQPVPDLPPLVHVRGVVDDGGTRWLIVSGHEPGCLLLREGANHLNVGQSGGVGASALGLDGDNRVEVYLSGPNMNDRATVRVCTPGGFAITSFEVSYQAGGILYINEDDGVPVMDGEPSTRRTINGVDLFQVTECKGHLVALADGGDTPGGCVVWVPPNGAMLMHQVPRGVQLAPRIAVNSSGEARIVYSGHDSPSMEFMSWEPYRRFVPPVVPLPPIELGPQRACWIDDMSGQGFGNCGGSGHPTAVFEDARFVLPADEPKVVALIHGPFEQSDLARTIPMAIRLSVPVIFADDGHSVADMKPHRDALEAAGVRLWEGPSAYPGQGPEGTVDAVEARLDAKLATDIRPHALIFPGYAVNGQSEAVIAQSCLSVNRLKNKYPNIKQVAIFGLDRPRDPALQLKWPRQFMVALTAQTPTPKIEVQTPPPVVVPVPPDPPPVTPPTDRDRAQLAGGIAAIAGAFVSLFTWWKRRKQAKTKAIDK